MEKLRLIIAQPCISTLILVFWGLVSTVAWAIVGFMALDIQDNFPIFNDDTGGGWTVFGVVLIAFSIGSVVGMLIVAVIEWPKGLIHKLVVLIAIYITIRPPLFCGLALINSRGFDVINLGLELYVGIVFLILFIVYKSNPRLKREIQTIRA